MLRTMRSAIRLLRHSPGFAAVTILTLALGIGANTAIFSLLNALVLRELPVRDPKELVQVSGIYRNGLAIPLSFPMFEQLRQHQQSFSGLIGWGGVNPSNVELNGVASLAQVQSVTGDYYQVLGTQAALGRLIAPSDVQQTAASPVAVLGYSAWLGRFGGDRSVIGRTIRIGGQVFTIIGVTERSFLGMIPGQVPEMTIPIGASRGFEPGNRSLLWVFATGRLAPGVTAERAKSQILSFWPALLDATVPTQAPGKRRESFLAMGLSVESAATGVNRALRTQLVQPLSILMGIVGFILLLVCVNLSSLSLARATGREREISVRFALGASTRQIAGQLLAETLALSAIGTAAALALAHWGSRILLAISTSTAVVPVTLDLRPDWRVLAFAAAAAAVTAVLIGLAPIWQLSREEAASVLRRNDRSLGRSTGVLGKGLIVAQVALSVVMLQGAGLLVGSLEKLRAFHPGFQREDVVEMELHSLPSRNRAEDFAAYRREVLRRVAAVPQVTSASYSALSIPAGESGWQEVVALQANDAQEANHATLAVVSPEFFETLGIPILAGRGFSSFDDPQHPKVAIVDAELAKRFGGVEAMLGQLVRFGVQPELQNLQVVGVARSARLVDVRRADRPVIYVPYEQQTRFGDIGNLVVRTTAPGAIRSVVDSAVRALGQEYVSRAETVAQATEQTLSYERVTAILSACFGGLALLLCGVGLFGLMSQTVSRRTREIGIRMALGSSRQGIVRLVLRQSAGLTALGIAVGIPAAVASTQLISHLLFDLSPGDTGTMAFVLSMLLAVAAVAGYLPARRAVRLDPMEAMRSD